MDHLKGTTAVQKDKEFTTGKIDVVNLVNKINNAASLQDLEKLKGLLFSKSGIFAEAMKNMVNLDLQEKKSQGKYLNDQKAILATLWQEKQDALQLKGMQEKINSETLDLTLPVAKPFSGGLHPISYAIEQIIAIFADMNFTVETGPEIETDWYNFTALNIPSHHPSRQEHDTFYLNSLDNHGNRKVLRTHTSNVQIRTMMTKKAVLEAGGNIRIIAPGRTYRSDNDATHSPMFQQVEGLYIDKIENINIPLLKACVVNFCEKFFAVDNLPLRLRSSYFPFTSPSFEADIQCDNSTEQLIIGKGKNWLEILGCGIIHPNVLNNCGINSSKYTGFAFGMGIERLVMLKYGFKDLRTLYEGDIRWLKYNNFNVLKNPTLFGGLE
ncbi:Phenylalanine--tRNA ligase subunit alpha [Candidatus Hepatincolaceae symbiont of Richtersius coronifer]